jgi:hypothetical protein
VLDRRRAEADVVPRRGLLNADVVGNAEPLLPRLVEHRLHEIAVDAAELDAVDTHPLELADALARLLGRPRNRLGSVARVDEEARARDLAPVAPLAELEDLARVGADVADRRDSRGEPELQLVLERLRRSATLVLDVPVRVDQPREDELPARVDLDVGCGTTRAPFAYSNRIEEDDLRDRVSLDDDVGRAAGRRPVAVDDSGVADRESGVALPAGDSVDLSPGRVERGGDEECENDEAHGG